MKNKIQFNWAQSSKAFYQLAQNCYQQAEQLTGQAKVKLKNLGDYFLDYSSTQASVYTAFKVWCLLLVPLSFVPAWFVNWSWLLVIFLVLNFIKLLRIRHQVYRWLRYNYY